MAGVRRPDPRAAAGGGGWRTGRRAGLVEKAASDWKNALVDLGGRNNLLHFRDLKLGTLDLTAADPGVVRGLLLGKATRVTALFRDPARAELVLRQVRTVHNKAKENLEERGLETLSIGCGLATWENKRAAWEPCAPVLLQHASLRPVGAAQDEFQLTVTGELEVNPTLVHALRADFGCKVDQAALEARIPDGVIDELPELEETYKWIAEQAREVPGFRVDRRIVLGNFAYAKLAMVNDLAGALDELVAHELIAALAGDEQAREAIRGQEPGTVPGPDEVPLADEFLVLDADSSQNYAINAVLAGQSLIVKGPPGTGKSQTIANLIASLIARDKKVLFVAEKRAAIDAVTKRLSQQNLGDLVLDLHDGVTSKRAFAEMIGRALAASRDAPRVDNGAELHRVERRREQLNAHVRAVHSRRQPWDLSVYEMRARLLGLEQARTEIRLRGAVIAAFSRAAARQAADDIADYARLGGLTLLTASPWAASPVVSAEEAARAAEVLDEVRRHTLPRTLALLERAAGETGLPAPAALSGWAALTGAWAAAGAVLSVMAPAVYDLDLREACEALAPAGRGALSRLWAALTSSRYKAARAGLRPAVTGGKLSDRDLYAAAVAARDGARTWAGLGGRGLPRPPGALPECLASHEHLTGQLGRLQAWSGQPALAEHPAVECKRVLGMLDADRKTLARLPELHRLRAALEAAGLGEFTAVMTARQASEDFAVSAFWYAWLASVLEHLEVTDLAVGSFSAETHQAAVRDYGNGDRHHIETTSARVRRAYGEHAVRARDEFKDQAALVQHQAGLKRRHLPVRDFVRNAPDVLLALKPCWAMSPLVVSQLLPPQPCFDVVIFDEASQITPADAVTSILRGRQLVVAGDDKQLPPSAWFVSDNPDDEPEPPDGAGPAPLMAGTGGFESILNALGSVLKFRTLSWHYRSRDERLIAFSNAHFYDRMLTTFPGTGGSSSVLRYVSVPWQPGADTNSPAPEVEAVVNLIIEHARQRPQESLGVITMGIRHRDRIEERLRQRLSQDTQLAAELAGFLDESRPERFFVKNLERVQGDERDAVIMSIGYGKNARGDLPYRFGPLLTEGGERRLNVAVTRAKNTLTFVSSFSAHDMDPGRSAAEGVKLLRQYLQYVESHGTNLGDQVLDKPPLNPFEIDVRDTLLRHGLKLTAQYGTSGYWIDYAVQHPVQPGRYVLAIECDGATYHSSPSARDRDRLRQEQLERQGWRFHRIWSTDWFHDKQACAGKAVAAYHEAVRAADNDGPAPYPSRPAHTIHASVQPGARPRTAYEAAPSRLTQVPGQRRGLRPPVISGQPIEAYSDAELLSLARWITTDDALRTEDELLQEMMRELGFQRRGKNVVARLTAAVRRSR